MLDYTPTAVGTKKFIFVDTAVDFDTATTSCPSGSKLASVATKEDHDMVNQYIGMREYHAFMHFLMCCQQFCCSVDRQRCLG